MSDKESGGMHTNIPQPSIHGVEPAKPRPLRPIQTPPPNVTPPSAPEKK